MKKGFLPPCVVFLGSFLLFGVQPMLGRTLLPSFGGSAAVWTVCLAAYQTLLLAGYYYAHRVAKFPARTQRRLHLALLAIAAAWVAVFALVRPSLGAFIGNGPAPALEVLFCVLVFVGLPYALLASGSTLVQAWMASGQEIPGGAEIPAREPGGGNQVSVYRLYAISNLGSFCGLLAYPFLLEPRVALSAQWWGFSAGLAVYLVLLAYAFPASSSCLPSEQESVFPSGVRPELRTQMLWLFLPGLSVFLLNAITAHLTMDVMPLPLLWVALLGVFLLSYVAGFSGTAERWLGACGFFAVACALAESLWLLPGPGGAGHFSWRLANGCALCLTCCAFLHGWLYRLRPASARQLTRYYLFNALGGACGGLLASLAAPLVFRTVNEFPLALLAFAATAMFLCFIPSPTGKRTALRWGCLVLAVGVAVSLVRGWLPLEREENVLVARGRGFFGTVSVLERPARVGDASGVLREFLHGTTVHGIQVRVPGLHRMPTAYFTPDAGGLAVIQHPKYKAGHPMRVGVLGLGIGVLAAYSRTDDYYRCYEISPEVLACATNDFTFLKDSPAHIELATGDARKVMEKERAAHEQRFDVLFVDAFTGDNLPAHLSTREAFQLYFDRLEPDGILAVNISNWHLDLTPLIKAVADRFRVPVVAIRQEDDMGRVRLGSAWAFFLPRPPAGFALPPGASRLDFSRVGAFALPTDEKGSFIGLVDWPWKK